MARGRSRAQLQHSNFGDRSVRSRADGIRTGTGGWVTSPLPFTEASVARAIKGVKRSGHFVVGVKPDGTLIVAEKPIDVTSLVAEIAQRSPDRTDWGARLGGKRETARS